MYAYRIETEMLGTISVLKQRDLDFNNELRNNNFVNENYLNFTNGRRVCFQAIK